MTDHPRKSLGEIFWAWLGGFSGIYAIWLLNEQLGIQSDVNLFLIGSFGASAVLLYGAPRGEFSQPRNLVGGHFISAIVGVLVYQWLPDHIALAAALAVSMSIAFMLWTHTTHPPGGATALIAVIGGSTIHELGFWYAINPVLLGVFVMLMMALIINNLSPNEDRHYPKYWW